MSQQFDDIVQALDELSPAELVALMGHISRHLTAYVGEVKPTENGDSEESSRRYLPRLPKLIALGLVVPMEDTLYVDGYADAPALLLDDKRVAYQGETLTINDWAKQITGWKGVNIYERVFVKRTGTTLDALRRQYLGGDGYG